MMQRKKGETHAQYNKRLEAELRKVIEGNKKCMDLLSTENKINPRTYGLYKSEAELMFICITLAEQQIRLENPEFAKMLLQEGIQRLGFTMVDIYDNSLANNPSKYNNEKL